MHFTYFAGKIFGVVLTCLLLHVNGLATVYIFTGSGANDNWNNVVNWSSGNYPGTTLAAGDIVQFLADKSCSINVAITIEGELKVGSGNNLNVNNNVFISSGGLLEVTSGGVVVIAGSYTLTIGVSADLNLESGSALINNGGIDNSGTVTCTTYNFSNRGTFNNQRSGSVKVYGLLSNAGTFDNETTASVSLSNGGFFNSGTINNSGSWSAFQQSTFTNTSTFNNNATGTYFTSGFYNSTFNNTGSLNNQGTYHDYGQITNDGTIHNYDSLYVVRVTNNGNFHNQASASASIGTEFINNAVLGNAGDLELSSSAVLTNNLEFYNWSTGTLTVKGICRTNAEILNNGSILNQGWVSVKETGNLISNNFENKSSGTFVVRGDYINNNLLLNKGDWSIKSTGTVNNNGTVNINSGGDLSNEGYLDNKSTGIFEVNGECTNHATHANTGFIEIKSSGKYTNNGDFNNWSAGTFMNGGIFQNMGTHLNNGAQSTTSTGTYSGSGTVTGGIDNMQGTLSPGSSPGVITVTGYLSLQSTATLKVEIAGTGAAGAEFGFDQVNVNDGNLSGTLEIILLDGFVPAVSYPYLILTSTNPISGTFANIVLPDGHDFVVTYNSNDVTIEYAGILPVELISFTGHEADEAVQLDWQTASELNNAGFEIQRMALNGTWETIGFVAGAGTTQHTQHYTYLDRLAPNGDNYYRLKQIDYDGQFEYSQVVHVRLDSEAAFSFYPNPATDYLRFSGLPGTATPVEIWDVEGKLRIAGTLNAQENFLNVQDLIPGFYMVRIGNSEQQARQSLIVLR